MTDPYRPEGSDRPWQRYGANEPPATGLPPQVDPAYAGQVPGYPAGYPPQGPHPTAQLPRQNWQPPQPPAGGPQGGGEGGPPEPPRFPKWLWLVAGAAVLLVVGMVIALVIANGSQRNSATVTPVTPLPTAPSVPVPKRTPTTTPPPQSSVPSTTPTTPSTPPPTTSTTGVPETIVYKVTGTGKVLSIAYLDTGGVLKTDFNVTLPWSKQVTLTPPASTAAAVTVVNFGAQITCSLSVDGAPVRERTGSILTVCAAAG